MAKSATYRGQVLEIQWEQRPVSDTCRNPNPSPPNLLQCKFKTKTQNADFSRGWISDKNVFIAACQFFQPPRWLASTPGSLQEDSGYPCGPACTWAGAEREEVAQCPEEPARTRGRSGAPGSALRSARNAAVLSNTRNHFKKRLRKGSCRNFARSPYWKSIWHSEPTWKIFQETCFFI